MNRWTVLFVASIFVLVLAMGCSSGGGSPVAPTTTPEITANSVTTGQTQTHCWGYWDIYIDLETQTVEAVPNHHAEFAANVVSFLNKQGGLAFNIYGTPVGDGYVDVDIDVSLTHPLQGLPQYDGYDVRGIFMADGSQDLMYGDDLAASNMDNEQFMLDDPVEMDGGGADGYTRWFNPDEFTAPGLLGYLPGAVASKNYTPAATLNPYKYFADGLAADGDLWEFLNTTEDMGVFSSGETNTRNYYLRFPMPPEGKGVQYGYAVVASWAGEAPEDHPANAMEAQAVSVTITDSLYYIDELSWGGDFIADIDVFDWGSALSAGVMEDYMLYIETDIATAPFMADSMVMTPTGGSDSYSTYHVEFTPDDITYNSSTAGDGEYWVIVEYPGGSYLYPEEPAPPAPDAALCAFFRFNDLYIHDTSYNFPPEITSGVTGEAAPDELSMETYTVVASDPDMDPLTYAWTVYDVGADEVVAGYDGVPGNGDGTIDIDWGDAAGVLQKAMDYEISCTVSDGIADPVPATMLEVGLTVAGDIYVSNHSDFSAMPENGTMTEPYHTITAAMQAATPFASELILVDDSGTYYDERAYMYNSSGSWADDFTCRGFSWYTEDGGRPVWTYTGYGEMGYFYYMNGGLTIRGFEFLKNASNGSSYDWYLRYCNDIKFIDNVFTGSGSSNNHYGVYAYYCYGIDFQNNKVVDFGTNASYTSWYAYGAYARYVGECMVHGNEVTAMCPDQYGMGSSGNAYGLYFYGPQNYSEYRNNLIHHWDMDLVDGLFSWGWYYGMYYSHQYSGLDIDINNNTIDNLQQNTGYTGVGGPGIYGIYNWYSYSGSTGVETHSNILSNLNGYSNYDMRGIYQYYGGQYADYNCTYNIDDTDIYIVSGVPGTNNISSDPMFVNNTTEPYDYTLDTGSPCIGTGKNSEDMGCYGNLPAGEVVGLLTPE